MRSENHQYLEFNDQVKKRYVRTVLQPITGYRLNPRNNVNPNERIAFVLATPDDNVEIIPYEEGIPTQVKQTKFSYEDEVLELYTDLEVRSFERMNKLLIENGILVPYNEQAPQIDITNLLTKEEILKIVKMRQTPTFKARVDQITSINTLKSLLSELEKDEDVKYTHIKYVTEKINEFNRRENKSTG